MKAYIASPFFNPKQLSDVQRVETACEKAYWNYYSPRLGNISKVYNELDLTKPEDREVLDLYKRMVFMEDIIEIDTSDVVFVNYNGKDSGTLFELGYAIYKKKRIICSSSDAVERSEFNKFYRHIKDVITSIPDEHNMLICRGDSVISGFHDLEDSSTKIVVAEHDQQKYTGISKVILGYLYALSEDRKEIDAIYIDVPRKSNLMLTGSSQVYECTNLNEFDNEVKFDGNTYYVVPFLENCCSLVKEAKDE